MAATFYTRYVPPGNAASPKAVETPDTPKGSQKRKRLTNADLNVDSPSKKHKKTKSKETAARQTATPEKNAGKRHESPVDQPKTKDPVSAPNDSRHSETAVEPEKGSKERRKKRNKGVPESDKPIEQHEAPIDSYKQPSKAPEKSSPRKKSKRKRDAADSEDASTGKHATIYSKFEKSIAKASLVASIQEQGLPDADDEVRDLIDESQTAHGLEPLPQPAPTSGPTEEPTYSTLPSWLMNPRTVSSEARTDFSSLGLGSKLVSTLEVAGYNKAFPVQSAVIPLLLKGEKQHPGDICISASTGSGKTIAYALPLVAEIEPSAIPTLRGLIVVPTRELVKQARDVCELFATGTGLRIGTAVGTASLRSEQLQLMRRDQVYDPSTYRGRQGSSMTPKDWADFSLHEYVAEVEQRNNRLPDHIPTFSPNVDILICTPGRLVDHIRSTKGFTLEHLQWLVIDEADKLLNESFQEWVEFVIPALESANHLDRGGRAQKLLQSLGFSAHKSRLRKVILSATMTRDVDKLNSLKLHNPKFVAVGNPDTLDGDGDDKDGLEGLEQGIALPPNLSESYVPVGDGGNKPLYLLTLLLNHIKLIPKDKALSKKRRSASVSSASDSSDTTSSSGSDSDDSSSESDSFDSSDSSSDSSSDESESEASSVADNSEPTEASKQSVLVFTHSSEAASRLSRLLTLLHPPLAGRIGTLTKSNKSGTSRKILAAYRQGNLPLIIATDRASRGLDLPGLSHVINYDLPRSLTTYIHRVGRTARAGLSGSAWTLVAHREGRWFSSEIARVAEGKIAREGKVEKIILKIDEDGTGLKKKYVEALATLGQEVAAPPRSKHSNEAKGTKVPNY
ncbi:hypothetical protein AJ80_03227 [Polytolypa hystricis UAMH7299]|uniref:ATP-dependent RNA helicase n=1 Tax=Polytolypa hystricis (strain UAMH7299) TaxID=1447883 RepID=A0A2B7YIQ4_POLH7|nr:hypothetical protein AJ80_03227 [Polytolypa hystricis UAMH7299]